jgi:hypothetical protein
VAASLDGEGGAFLPFAGAPEQEEQPMTRARSGTSLLLATILGAMAAGTTLAAQGDELAQTLSQSLTSLETQIAIAPEEAVLSLERQKRQLTSLREAAPQHPMIPDLEQRIQQLEERANTAVEAAGRAEEEEALTAPEGEIGPMQPPLELAQRLRKVEGLQRLADRELLRGAIEEAKSYAGQARAEMDQIQAEFADQVPRGYADLIVADERLAALEDMIAAEEN